MAWHGMAWHGMAWHGMAWHGMAWHGMYVCMYVLNVYAYVYVYVYEGHIHACAGVFAFSRFVCSFAYIPRTLGGACSKGVRSCGWAPRRMLLQMVERRWRLFGCIGTEPNGISVRFQRPGVLRVCGSGSGDKGLRFGWRQDHVISRAQGLSIIVGRPSVYMEPQRGFFGQLFLKPCSDVKHICMYTCACIHT